MFTHALHIWPYVLLITLVIQKGVASDSSYSHTSSFRDAKAELQSYRSSDSLPHLREDLLVVSEQTASPEGSQTFPTPSINAEPPAPSETASPFLSETYMADISPSAMITLAPFDEDILLTLTASPLPYPLITVYPGPVEVMPTDTPYPTPSDTSYATLVLFPLIETPSYISPTYTAVGQIPSVEPSPSRPPLDEDVLLTLTVSPRPYPLITVYPKPVEVMLTEIPFPTPSSYEISPSYIFPTYTLAEQIPSPSVEPSPSPPEPSPPEPTPFYTEVILFPSLEAIPSPSAHPILSPLSSSESSPSPISEPPYSPSIEPTLSPSDTFPSPSSLAPSPFSEPILTASPWPTTSLMSSFPSLLVPSPSLIDPSPSLLAPSPSLLAPTPSTEPIFTLSPLPTISPSLIGPSPSVLAPSPSTEPILSASSFPTVSPPLMVPSYLPLAPSPSSETVLTPSPSPSYYVSPSLSLLPSSTYTTPFMPSASPSEPTSSASHSTSRQPRITPSRHSQTPTPAVTLSSSPTNPPSSTFEVVNEPSTPPSSTFMLQLTPSSLVFIPSPTVSSWISPPPDASPLPSPLPTLSYFSPEASPLASLLPTQSYISPEASPTTMRTQTASPTQTRPVRITRVTRVTRTPQEVRRPSLYPTSSASIVIPEVSPSFVNSVVISSTPSALPSRYIPPSAIPSVMVFTLTATVSPSHTMAPSPSHTEQPSPSVPNTPSLRTLERPSYTAPPSSSPSEVPSSTYTAHGTYILPSASASAQLPPPLMVTVTPSATPTRRPPITASRRPTQPVRTVTKRSTVTATPSMTLTCTPGPSASPVSISFTLQFSSSVSSQSVLFLVTSVTKMDPSLVSVNSLPSSSKLTNNNPSEPTSNFRVVIMSAPNKPGSAFQALVAFRKAVQDNQEQVLQASLLALEEDDGNLYSVTSSRSTGTSSAPVGAIVGAVVGVCIAAIAVGGVIYFIRRRRAASTDSPGGQAITFHSGNHRVSVDINDVPDTAITLPMPGSSRHGASV